MEHYRRVYLSLNTLRFDRDVKLKGIETKRGPV